MKKEKDNNLLMKLQGENLNFYFFLRPYSSSKLKKVRKSKLIFLVYFFYSFINLFRDLWKINLKANRIFFTTQRAATNPVYLGDYEEILESKGINYFVYREAIQQKDSFVGLDIVKVLSIPLGVFYSFVRKRYWAIDIGLFREIFQDFSKIRLYFLKITYIGQLEIYNFLISFLKVEKAYFIAYYVQIPALLACREQNVITYEIQHGVIHPDNMFYNFVPDVKNLPLPDIVCFWSSYFMGNSELPPTVQRLVIGSNQFNRKDISKTLVGDYLFLFQYTHFDALASFMIEIIELIPDSKSFLVKFHPLDYKFNLDGMTQLKKKLRSKGNCIFLDNSLPAENYFSDKTKLISLFSFSIYVALYQGMSVYLPKELSTPYSHFFNKFGKVFLLDSQMNSEKIGSNEIDGRTIFNDLQLNVVCDVFN